MVTFLVLLTVAATPASTSVKANTYHPTFTTMVSRVNVERAKRNLPPVQADPALMASSARHTQWMLRNNTLAHTKGVAEIAATGHTTTAGVIQGWMNSGKGHKEIILGNYKYVGAAGYFENGRYYWCMQFSKSKNSKVTTPPVIKYDAPMRYIIPAQQFQSS